MLTKFWSELLKGRDHSEDLGVDGLLDRILEKEGDKLQCGHIWLRIGTTGSCGHSNEPLGSITGGEFLE
jgi:hypothetical protein